MGPTSSTLIATHMPMATRIAHTFAGRGEDLDDLIQVAMLELVKAVSRFDSTRGVTFAHYAYPCIVGGIKKHFRDNGWSVHVPRRMQELHLRISRAAPGLTQTLGRPPKICDLAAHLNLSEQDTRDGFHTRLAYKTLSLSLPVREGDEAELGQIFGSLDEHLESVPDRHSLALQVATLPRRERDILRLRFSFGLTQLEIAERLGISQMHVSRLLAQSIGRLRARILAASRLDQAVCG
ncbi:MAG TPA: B/F/G family RNA polymerase sigma-70 factor [Micromonosporaceae bacterium]|nr:B/F/G family RNA polymerase sigma-70 factor [Micromonosporaceae bacterium]